jgi:tight adherence protein B
MSGATIRLLFLASFILLMGLGGAALLIDNSNRTREKLRGRLERIMPAAHGDAAPTSLRIATERTGLIGRFAGLIGCDFARRRQYPLPWWIVPIAAIVVGRLAVMAVAPLLGNTGWAALPIVWFLVTRGVYKRWDTKRRDKLLVQMPDALGMIIRTVRVGIPVLEGMRLVGREAAEPTGTEFRQLVEEVAIGVPLDVALRVSAERTGMAEYRFFATAIGLQMQTGGGLSEALENLADVLRRRLALRDRGFALTSEARTSALVLVLMPFIIGGATTFIAPGTVDVLFTTSTGNKMLGIGTVSMSIGVVVMRTMIRRTLS